MTRMRFVLAALAVLTGVSGCSRHVVLPPQDVAARNDPDWRVLCKPNAANADATSTDAHCSKQ